MLAPITPPPTMTMEARSGTDVDMAMTLWAGGWRSLTALVNVGQCANEPDVADEAVPPRSASRGS